MAAVVPTGSNGGDRYGYGEAAWADAQAPVGDKRREAAFARALTIASPTYDSIAAILTSGLDRHPLPAASPPSALPEHQRARAHLLPLKENDVIE